MTRKGARAFDANSSLATVGTGRTIAKCSKNKIVSSQGDTADAVFYAQKGKIKLSVLSKDGKEAVVGILGPGSPGRSPTQALVLPIFLPTPTHLERE